MSRTKIPIRPSGTFKLSQQEQEALSWHIISGMARTEVYRRFVRPDLETSKAALDKLTKMFFEDKEVKRYMEEYQSTLDNFLNPKEKPKKKVSEEEMKERILKGMEKLREFALDQADVIATLEEPGEVIKLWRNLGLFGDEEEVAEAPRRYLPETCNGGCRYKAFCEKECEDLCEICKYKKYANENGVHYKSENQLINNQNN